MWVRVLLPQITGNSSAAPSSSPGVPATGGGGSRSAAGPASTGGPQQHQDQPQLSPASADKAFAYLDELLKSQTLKQGMVTGVPFSSGDAPLPLLPPSAVVSVAQVCCCCLHIFVQR